jgi:polysaccharide pyruvyl transferase WcaK-like protein
MDLIPNTFKHIYLRDEYDIAAMKQKVSCPVDLTPDLAFFYRPRGEDVMRRYTLSSKRMSLGVMLTDYINPAIDRPQADFTAKAESFKIKLAKELDKLARHGWDIYLIPLSTTGYGNDIRINLDVASFMQERPIIIYETLSPQECIDLVAQMDLTVCMKFHAYIFSMIAGVPFVSLGLTRKVDLFLGAHDLKKFTAAKFDETGTQFNTSKFAEVVDDVLTHKQTLSNKFIDISDRHYRRLHELSDKIRRDWLGEQ